MTEEVRILRRLSIYALVVGVVYWVVSYEWIGTTLLILFGVGTAVATVYLWRGARARGFTRDADGMEAGTGVEGSGGLADAAGPVGSAAAGSAMPGSAATSGPSPAPGEPDGPFGDEAGRIPASSMSPFLVGLAVALLALGLVFGAWFILAALIPFALGAGGWLAAVRGELRGVEDDDAEAGGP